MVTLQSLCCGATRRTACSWVLKICRVIRIKLNQLVDENFRMITILLRKWYHSNKHFSELAHVHYGGKTTGIDMIWRNYVTVTLYINTSHIHSLLTTSLIIDFCCQCLLLLLHPFNGLFSRITRVSRHQKGKPFGILLEQEMMGWQWHQLDHMQTNIIMCLWKRQ